MQRKVMFGIFVVVLCGVIYLLYVFNYIPHRKYTNDYFQIEPYISEVDKDLDGVDDQTDILNGVRSYLQTNIMLKDIQMMDMVFVRMLLLLV